METYKYLCIIFHCLSFFFIQLFYLHSTRRGSLRLNKILIRAELHNQIISLCTCLIYCEHKWLNGTTLTWSLKLLHCSWMLNTLNTFHTCWDDMSLVFYFVCLDLYLTFSARGGRLY